MDCSFFLVPGSCRITSRPLTLNTISGWGDLKRQLGNGGAFRHSQGRSVVKANIWCTFHYLWAFQLQHTLSDLLLVVLLVSLVPLRPRCWKGSHLLQYVQHRQSVYCMECHSGAYREFLLNLSYIVAVVFRFNPLCVIEDKPQNDSSFLDVFAGVRFHQPCFKNSDSMPVEDAVDVARVKVQYIYFYKFEYSNQVLQIKTSWGDEN